MEELNFPGANPETLRELWACIEQENVTGITKKILLKLAAFYRLFDNETKYIVESSRLLKEQPDQSSTRVVLNASGQLFSVDNGYLRQNAHDNNFCTLFCGFWTKLHTKDRLGRIYCDLERDWVREVVQNSNNNLKIECRNESLFASALTQFLESNISRVKF